MKSGGEMEVELKNTVISVKDCEMIHFVEETIRFQLQSIYFVGRQFKDICNFFVFFGFTLNLSKSRCERVNFLKKGTFVMCVVSRIFILTQLCCSF